MLKTREIQIHAIKNYKILINIKDLYLFLSFINYN